MDFDNAKENIQPLASGRNVNLLQASLSQDASQELIGQRKQFELDIKNYDGADPLQPWYAYICWIEQSYPAGGSNSGLHKVMQKCLTIFERDERYKQDRRLIKLFIKFMDKQLDQIECYQHMYDNGIGTMLADFYIAWAYSYDLSGNMRRANEIFRLGVECRAEPLEELKEAQHHFGYAVAQRMFYSDGEESSTVTQELNNRRLALCSLYGQKQKSSITVGSVRTGAAIKSSAPGVLQCDVPTTSRASRKANRQHEVFNDENIDINMPPSAIEPSSQREEKSSLRSIIDAARQQENLKESIPWTKPGKHGRILSIAQSHDPAFHIHVDEKTMPPITDYERNFENPFKFASNWVRKSKPQEAFVTPVTIEDEPDAKTLPCYNKVMLYPRPNIEFSMEEYRAYCWLKRHNDQHPFVQRHSRWWATGFDFGVRLYPNFLNKSKPQTCDEMNMYLKPPVEESLRPILNKIYNEEEQQEYQVDEILAANWRQKKNITVHGIMDMDETVCLPGEQMPRRKSFFPTLHTGQGKKSVLSRISCIMEQDETKETNYTENNLPGEAVIKIDPTPETITSPKAAQIPPQDKFAVPAPPSRKIEIYEDEANLLPSSARTHCTPFFDADETCSTQTFNIFIKSQAVSTPKAQQKGRQFGTIIKETHPSSTEDYHVESEAAPLPVTSSQPVSPIQRKQLSTILETSEHGATNGTTKSTLTSASTSPGSLATALLTTKLDTVQATPGPMRLQRQMQGDLSVVDEEFAAGNFERLELWEPSAPSLPFMKSLRFQEDKTETVPRPLMSCFQDDKTETLHKLPLAFPESELHQLSENAFPLQPSVPQVASEYDDDDLCRLFAKSPPRSKTFASPLMAATSKRTCLQHTPKLISKSVNETQNSLQNSFEVFEDQTSARPMNKPTSNINKLVDSFMDDLSFVPETQQKPSLSSNSQITSQNQFEVFLNDTMPPPAVLKVINSTLSDTQQKVVPNNLQTSAAFANAVGPTHLTASFMKDCTDLSNCASQLLLPDVSAPSKNQTAVRQNKFEIFLDESLSQLPASTIVDFPLSETQTESVQKGLQVSSSVIEKLERISSAHQTVSFMKDCTEFRKCTPVVSGEHNRSTSTNSKFLRDSLLDSEDISKQAGTSKSSNDYFELNAATEMFASNISMIKNSTLLPEISKRSTEQVQVASLQECVPALVINDKVEDDGTIYYKKTPLTPKLSQTSWDDASVHMPKESYEHRKTSIDESILNGTLADANVNPFNSDVITSLLDSIDFSLYIEKLPNCQMQGHVARLAPHSSVVVQGEKFDVHKILGKGAYGVVFKGIQTKTGKKVALKQEKPTNYWEYYICLEIHSRLANEKMIPAFMSVDYALVGNNSSIYISELSEYGSLICVCNKFKKNTNKNLDEYVVMHLSCQLLDIVDHLHSLGIIHADIKADNFLLMKPLSLHPNELSLQLIDFGVAIDTKLFAPNQTFHYVHNEDAFKCIEMRTKRPWTYQLDLFGLAGVMHVLLFGRYMEVTERQPSGIWMPRTTIPRYYNRQAWDSIYRSLLNVRDCRSMPNLQQLRALLKSELADKDRYVEAAVAKFNLIIQRS